MDLANLKICIRGGGELASAVAHRLHRCNFKVLLTEIANPQAVRRQVAFCEAVYNGSKEVEGVFAKLVSDFTEIEAVWRDGAIPLIVDPETKTKSIIKPDVLIDAIIAKRNTGTEITDAPLVIGLGIGFYAGRDVHIVIETNRGHNLGRVILKGEAEADTGVPGVIGGYSRERVFRAPKEGQFKTSKGIGEFVKAGDIVAVVDDYPVKVEIDGIIRGILADGTIVHKGMKSGDIDPRGKKEYCDTISDKGRAIAGGVLEAILSFVNK
jgi:xanthine dehydrogenase accessory factor